MADSLGTSAGGRIAFIYRKKEKRRRMTSMMNEIARKKLEVVQRQIKDYEHKELNEMDRRYDRVFKSNDDIKAFQKALLQRLSTVNHKSQMARGNRPLYNLGRYGGASIEQIKTESEKFKPIRDPEKLRMIRAKKLLEQGNSDGRIINFHPKLAGDLTERILKLDKIDLSNKNHRKTDLANLEDVQEADEVETNAESAKVRQFSTLVVKRRHLTLPPVKERGQLIPNYSRHSPVESHVIRKTFPLQGIVTQLTSEDGSMEEGNTLPLKPPAERKYFEWDYTKPLGPISKGNKRSIEEPQKFWKPNDSLVLKPFHQRIVLPRIR